MARQHTYRSPCNNFPPIDKDELVENALRAPINGNGTLTSTFATFCAFTPTFTLGLSGIYTDIDF